MSETIIYEQPLNEIIRACLRLEQLFQQIDHHLKDTSLMGTRNVIICIINALQLLDRPDLKAKLAKEINHHLATLMRYEKSTELNVGKFNDLTNQLDEMANKLIDTSGKIAHRIRDIELLNTLRLHLTNPGGCSSFDTPIYHYWLQQHTKLREKIIADWMNDFSQIRRAVELVLDLVRRNAKVEEKNAIHGFYQELLDPQSHLRMIRIGLSPDIPAYPETSIGRHFLSVRFYDPNIEKRPSQYTENLPFWISYCTL